MAFWKASGFQSLLSELSSFLESLHDLIMVWLFVILVVVGWVSLQIYWSPLGYVHPDSEVLEQGWTILPILVLLSIAYPSILLLCLQDSFHSNPSSTIKMLGNQWNWQSEAEDQIDHLMDVDFLENVASYEAPVFLNLNHLTRIVVGSSDVLHSLGLPAMGIKLDATPGRLNATSLEVNIPSVVAGSCFELCGSGHSAMPVNFIMS